MTHPLPDQTKCETPIPLPTISSECLSKVIEFCKYHTDHPDPPSEEKRDERRTDDISPWDQNFCKVHQALLFEMISV